MNILLKTQHNKVPEGFKEPYTIDDSGDRAANITTYYNPLNSKFSIYGVTGHFDAVFETFLEQKIIFFEQKVLKHRGKIRVSFSYKDSDPYNSDIHDTPFQGVLVDPEKLKRAGCLTNGLKKKLDEKGYICISTGTGLEIYPPKNTTDIHKSLGLIANEIRTIEADYNAGKKPLGDIDSLEKSNDETKKLWSEKLQGHNAADKITELVKQFFPEGTEITQEKQGLFANELIKLLSPSRER